MLTLLLVFEVGFTSGSDGQAHTLIILVDTVSNSNGVVGVLVFNSPGAGQMTTHARFEL